MAKAPLQLYLRRVYGSALARFAAALYVLPFRWRIATGYYYTLRITCSFSCGYWLIPLHGFFVY